MDALIAGIPVLGVIGIIAGAIVALTVIVKALHTAWLFLRRINEFIDDWAGEPARKGVPARPGVMTRLASIEERLGPIEELRPNGGSSLYDKVTRVDQRTDGSET